jgi:glutathione-regulated potassium-efflux system ancillary protein KefC
LVAVDAILLAVAFGFGLAAHLLRLPPLVGFLVAGFVLHALGAEGGEALEVVSDLGVLLLLFSIGLKLRVRDLLRTEVWATASGHLLLMGAIFAGCLWVVAAWVADPSSSGSGRQAVLLVAFALSFSSTVFAVKALEEKGERGALYGRTAIGILVVQDLVAVLFLSFALGHPPLVWALGLLALPLLRAPMGAILRRAGRGELLVLSGFVIALLGAELFERVHLEGDVGALVLGMLLADNERAEELAKSLLAFKDLFLVGFFLSIGLYGVPEPYLLLIAVLLTALLPVKALLFTFFLVVQRLRARTAFLTALALTTYSEFGLIVGYFGVKNGILPAEWLSALAIALSLSFAIAAPLNSHSHALFGRVRPWLRRFESTRLHPEDRPIDPGAAEIVVFGMGRVGVGAYDAMRERYGDVVLGIDYDSEVVAELCADGRRVILGDPTDCDFWERSDHGASMRAALLAMPDHDANIDAIGAIREQSFACQIAAIARHDDEVRELESAGAAASFNFYRGVGLGFADSVAAHLEAQASRNASAALDV